MKCRRNSQRKQQRRQSGGVGTHSTASKEKGMVGIPQALGLGLPTSKRGREHPDGLGFSSRRNVEEKEESEFSSSKIGQRKLGKIAWRGNGRRKEGAKRMKSTATHADLCAELQN